MKGLIFANTQQSCFEAWKRSYMSCFALLCGRFDDSQESRFLVTKRSNMCSAVLLGGRSADFTNYVFKLQNVHMDCVEVQEGLFADSQKCFFRFETFR